MINNQTVSSQIPRANSWKSVLKKLFPFLAPYRIGKWTSHFIKRTFDIFISIFVLILLAPIFSLIAIAIKRDTPGPVFYRGPRIGRGGKTFKILKFRTMYEAPESYAGPGVTAHDDTRITPLGHWLRNTKINEFPQFWNVLKGEMSLVGPRPEDPNLAKTWPVDMGREILSVRPGITSPASVLYRNEETLLSFKDVLQKYLQDLGPDKMRLDQLYVRHRSFWLDLDVLFWTFLIVLPIIGSYSPPEELLFVGPVTRFIRRYLNWFSVDMFITFTAILFTHLVWEVVGPLSVTWKLGLAHAVVFSFLFSTTGLFMGVNLTRWSKATPADFARLLGAWLIAWACATAINEWLQIYPSIIILTASAISLLGFILARFNSRFAIFLMSRMARYLHAEVASERVLIVGSGRTAESVSWVLNHPTYSDKFRVVGYVDDNMFAHGMRVYGASILGGYSDIPELVRNHDIGLVILADNRIALRDYQAITEICDGKSTRLVVIPDVFGALKNLVAFPTLSMVSRPEEQILPIYPSLTVDGKASPCHFCAGRYTRLEMEAQVEKAKG